MQKNVKWVQPDGKPISCKEKIKVLDENYEEIKDSVKNAIEDAIVMGCSEAAIKKALKDLIDETKVDIKESQKAI